MLLQDASHTPPSVDWGLQGYGPRSNKPIDWRSTFQRHVIEVVGDKPINKYTRAHTLTVMEPLWNSETHKAKEILTRLRKVFDWAVGQGHMEYNIADSAAIAPLPPRRHIRTHHPSVDYRHIEEYIIEILKLDQFDPALREGLIFLILTGGRHIESYDLEWPELHMDYPIFTPRNRHLQPLTFPCLVIPAERMKRKDREHVIPLSTQALRILLKALEFRHRHPLKVFPKALGGSNRSLDTKRLRDAIDFATGTAHGFRASFSTWAQEHAVPGDLAEAALAHRVGGVRGAYARSVLLSRRVYLMMDWADYNTGAFPDGYLWRERFIPEDLSTYPPLPDLSPDEWATLDEASRSNPKFTLFDDVQEAYKSIRLARDASAIALAAQFMALTASRPTQVVRALLSEIVMGNGTWNVPGNHIPWSGQDYSVPLSPAARTVAKKAQRIDWQSSDLLFQSETGASITNSILNDFFNKLQLNVTPEHFRAAFIMWCEEIGVDEALIGELCGRKQETTLAPVDKPDTLNTRAKLMKAWETFLSGKLPADWRWQA